MLTIIESLVKLTKDKLEIVRYERLAPLTVMNTAIGSFDLLESGDCVVGFSRKALFHMKKTIENSNPKLKCCVI